MKPNRLQIIIVAAALLLSVVIYMMPSQVNMKAKPADATRVNKGGLDETALLQSAATAIDSTQLPTLRMLEDALKKNGDQDTALLDQIGRFWDNRNIPAAAAIWFEKKSAIQKTELSYLDAAYRYFDAFKMAGDSSLRGMMVQKAIENYNKVIEINPENLNAKTDLGACYAEGTGEPMKGIMLLREVVSKNPEHEMAQYNLGMLSVKSGQLDKAIERFTKVLEINPKRSEMYFYLGQIYVSKGEPDKAIGYYESFVKNTNDPQAAQEVKKIISDLKKGKV
ncbi:MAG TPA: tetratricopeptide repeat protein [Bacteroidia bacterium]|jgi:tetratricopeptide (TPR) repeat protein|nr:tetratricopeptide repeat protein [Bacteroidia bacterium]HQF27538.1 tetratricopeptide repeat protein [Bacteroidia bacterium]